MYFVILFKQKQCPWGLSLDQLHQGGLRRTGHAVSGAVHCSGEAGTRQWSQALSMLSLTVGWVLFSANTFVSPTYRQNWDCSNSLALSTDSKLYKWWPDINLKGASEGLMRFALGFGLRASGRFTEFLFYMYSAEVLATPLSPVVGVHDLIWCWKFQSNLRNCELFFHCCGFVFLEDWGWVLLPLAEFCWNVQSHVKGWASGVSSGCSAAGLAWCPRCADPWNPPKHTVASGILSVLWWPCSQRNLTLVILGVVFVPWTEHVGAALFVCVDVDDYGKEPPFIVACESHT